MICVERKDLYVYVNAIGECMPSEHSTKRVIEIPKRSSQWAEVEYVFYKEATDSVSFSLENGWTKPCLHLSSFFLSTPTCTTSLVWMSPQMVFIGLNYSIFHTLLVMIKMFHNLFFLIQLLCFLFFFQWIHIFIWNKTTRKDVRTYCRKTKFNFLKIHRKNFFTFSF